MPELTLEIPGHLELHVGTRSGRVSITGEDRQDLHIESDAPIREEKIRVDSTGRVTPKSSRGGSGWPKDRCPAAARLPIGPVSGRREAAGRLARGAQGGSRGARPPAHTPRSARSRATWGCTGRWAALASRP